MLATSSRSNNDRIICLIDMDCFYVQVEEVEAPEFRGKPCGVSQYNPYRGGGLIAVNYEARKYGVKRGMRGEEAKALCPEFQTFYVNQKRGKADLTKYRNASLKIFEIISKYNCIVEKASIDEAYLDLTDLVLDWIRNNKISKIQGSDLSDSFVVGKFTLENNTEREINLNSWLEMITDLTIESNDAKLAVGAMIVQEIRQDIFTTLGYHCSAGIAHNKTLAKFCCGINKPKKQTILPLSSVEDLLEKSPINKIKNLGGKLGFILSEELNLKTVGDVAKLSLTELVKKFGEKTGNWLNQISHGIDQEQVLARQQAKSIGCSKNFRGKQALDTIKKVTFWIKNLCEELEERLEDDKTINQREPTQLVVHITNEAGTFSKSTNIKDFGKNFMSDHILELISIFNKQTNKNDWQPSIFTLGLSATKFIDLNNKSKQNSGIFKYFANAQITTTKTHENEEDNANSSLSKSNEPSTNNSKSLSEELEKAADSLLIKNTTLVNNIKKTPKLDIKSLLLNQKTKTKMVDEEDSDKDADSDILFDDSNSNEQPIQNQNVNPLIDENVDLILCETCNKKILVWEMPEHQDFHYAQQLSKEICIGQTPATSNNCNKRVNDDHDNAVTLLKKSNIKKLKTENHNTSVKQIDKYFKKIN